MLRLLTILAAHGLLAIALAQGYRVAVIVHANGPLGALQALAAERTAAALTPAGVFGRPLTVLVLDDGGVPERAVALALQAADEGIHAVVCCTDAAAGEAVAPALEARMVPHFMLAPHALGGFWGVSIAAFEREALTAIAVDAARLGKASVAWMAPTGAAGDAASAEFVRAAADASVAIAGEARYPSDAAPLTPEGLWIATREPGAVVVWGGDLALALAGLRGRGYEGVVYARADAPTARTWGLAEAHDGRWSVDDGALGVRVAVSPAAFPGLLPATHPHAAAVAAFEKRVPESRGQAAWARTALAQVDDALIWLQRALEDVAAIPVPLTLTGERLALRDAWIAAPLTRLAAGAYDASEGEMHAARWSGLVIAAVIR